MRKDVLKQIQRIRIMGIKPNYNSLAKQLNCDPRTVKNYSKGITRNKRKSRKIKSKLEDFKSTIEDKVDNYAASAISIYNFIKLKGYTGKYGLVKDYIRNYKNEQTKKATIRFETNPGIQGQVDFKERKKMKSKTGKIYEFHIFLYVLGYSRTKYLELTINKDQNTVFRCLTNAFKATKGVPQEILFDNMPTVVDRHNTYLGNVKYNQRFSQFAKDFNFKPIACKPYRAQTKGKVEALSKLTKRLDVYNEEFETLEDLQRIIKELNKELNIEISQAINQTPNERLSKEAAFLKQIPSKEIVNTYLEGSKKKYKVSKESMIKYLGNKYSVPTYLIGKRVEIRTDQNKLKIFFNNDFIVCHSLSDKLFNYKKDHVIEILRSDAFKYSSEKEIEKIIDKNLNHMDVLLT